MDFLIEDTFLGVSIMALNDRARDWFNSYVSYGPAQKQNDGAVFFEKHMATLILPLMLYYGFKVQIDGTPRSRK